MAGTEEIRETQGERLRKSDSAREAERRRKMERRDEGRQGQRLTKETRSQNTMENKGSAKERKR